MSASDENPSGGSSLWARRLLMISGSAIFSIVLILALEGVLRVSGLGDPVPWTVSRVQYQHYSPPLLRPAERADGTKILRTVDPRLPYQSVLADKPADGLRVVCFGGSAMAGLGFSPNVTVARSLEEMLKAAQPERTVEVLNLGLVAFSSVQVRGMVAEVCARYEPDLIVVYSGNNEFLEIHAQKYALHHGGFAQYARDTLVESNLYRLLLGIGKAPKPLAVTEKTSGENRLSEATLIEDIHMSEDDMQTILSGYEENLDFIAGLSVQREIPLVMMSVATNWEWRGKQDLAAGWLQELVGVDAGEAMSADLRRRGIAILDERLANPSAEEPHEEFFMRALLHDALGDFEAAREDYRSALNSDPHLRRALDGMNERVAAIANKRSVAFVDSVELLIDSSEHGIVGYGEFYDYVHFTPRGRLYLAAGLFERIRAMGLVPKDAVFDSAAFVQERLAALAERADDFQEARRWIGFCDDRSMLTDRDLWKYDKMLRALDERLEQNPGDFKSLVWRGNARYFRQDGAAGAESDYRAALVLDPAAQAVQDNLQLLLSERPKVRAE